MTDPIGTAQERELIGAICAEANSWAMTKPNRAHKLRAAADALQSRIAEVAELRALVFEMDEQVADCCGCLGHIDPEFRERINAAALSLQRRPT